MAIGRRGSGPRRSRLLGLELLHVAAHEHAGLGRGDEHDAGTSGGDDTKSAALLGDSHASTLGQVERPRRRGDRRVEPPDRAISRGVFALDQAGRDDDAPVPTSGVVGADDGHATGIRAGLEDERSVRVARRLQKCRDRCSTGGLRFDPPVRSLTKADECIEGAVEARVRPHQVGFGAGQLPDDTPDDVVDDLGEGRRAFDALEPRPEVTHDRFGFAVDERYVHRDVAAAKRPHHGAGYG